MQTNSPSGWKLLCDYADNKRKKNTNKMTKTKWRFSEMASGRGEVTAFSRRFGLIMLEQECFAPVRR